MEKETRKLKSRCAAHSRRVLENGEFECLALSLPIPRAISSHLLDKASTVRLTISYLRLCDFTASGSPSWLVADQRNQLLQTSERVETVSASPWQYLLHQEEQPAETGAIVHFFHSNLGARILEATDGFLFCISDDATILYVSETVSIGLGLSQIELIGRNMGDYLHHQDADQFFNLLASFKTRVRNQNYSPEFPMADTTFLARIKSSLVKRGCKDSSDVALGYRAVEIHLAPRLQSLSSGWLTNIGFCGFVCPLPSAGNPIYRLDDWTFVLTTTLDLKIHYVDLKAQELLLTIIDEGNDQTNQTERTTLVGTSFYNLIHPEDVKALSQLHKNVLRIGSACSQYFRLMRVRDDNNLFTIPVDGQFVWVFAYAIRVNRPRSRQNQHLITFICSMLS